VEVVWGAVGGCHCCSEEYTTPIHAAQGNIYATAPLTHSLTHTTTDTAVFYGVYVMYVMCVCVCMCVYVCVCR
jgi:hypothetical protein